MFFNSCSDLYQPFLPDIPKTITAKKEAWASFSVFRIRRLSTLPGRCQPSTIDVWGLNFCVRDGNRWIPSAIVTGNCELFLFPLLPWQLYIVRRRVCFPLRLFIWSSLLAYYFFSLNQAFDWLVPTTYIHYCTYSVGLSPGSLPGVCMESFSWGGLHA